MLQNRPHAQIFATAREQVNIFFHEGESAWTKSRNVGTKTKQSRIWNLGTNENCELIGKEADVFDVALANLFWTQVITKKKGPNVPILFKLVDFFV